MLDAVQAASRSQHGSARRSVLEQIPSALSSSPEFEAAPIKRVSARGKAIFTPCRCFALSMASMYIAYLIYFQANYTSIKYLYQMGNCESIGAPNSGIGYATIRDTDTCYDALVSLGENGDPMHNKTQYAQLSWFGPLQAPSTQLPPGCQVVKRSDLQIESDLRSSWVGGDNWSGEEADVDWKDTQGVPVIINLRTDTSENCALDTCICKWEGKIFPFPICAFTGLGCFWPPTGRVLFGSTDNDYFNF